MIADVGGYYEPHHALVPFWVVAIVMLVLVVFAVFAVTRGDD